MFGSLIQPEIHELIAARDFAAIREVFADWPPADLAELINDLPDEERVLIFRLLPHTVASSVFEYLEIESQRHLLLAMGDEQIAQVVNEMSPDDRTHLLEELPSTAVTQLLRLLSPKEREVAQTLLNYPEHSIGRLMSPDFIAVYDDWTMRQVLDHVREHGQDKETLNVIYVIDERGLLIDDIHIREFLLKPLDTSVREIRDNLFVALRVSDSESDAVAAFRKYHREALPVADGGGLLVGIVTADDVLAVVEEETTSDIQKIGGSEALDEPYDRISMGRMLRKRAPWLIILFISEMFTSNALSHFQDEIEKIVVLAFFVPLIISSGGNSGSQATTLVIRALALGQIRLRDWWRVMHRELMVGLLLGMILGVVGYLRVMSQQTLHDLFPHLFGGYGIHPFLMAATISCSLVGVVAWGTLIGASLPFLLRSLRLDPAVASAPFVATLVDVTGIFIYFSVAAVIMRG